MGANKDARVGRVWVEECVAEGGVFDVQGCEERVRRFEAGV